MEDRERETEHVSARVPKDIKIEAQVKAVRGRITLSQAIAMLLEAWVKGDVELQLDDEGNSDSADLVVAPLGTTA